MNKAGSMESLSTAILQARNRYLQETATDYLPNKREVTEIIELLRRLVFPGYFEDPAVGTANTEDALRSLIHEVHYKLQRQICRALKMVDGENARQGDAFSEADDICRRFLAKIPALMEMLRDDVQAAFDGDPAAGSTGEVIFAYPGILAVSVYRLAHELWLLSVPLIPRMMTEQAHSATGIDIHPGADIGRFFFIDHGTGIVIGETTKIGERVKLYQGVTLGALSTQGGHKLRGKKRHPTIEDGVTIYSGASILGGDTLIGKNSVIGGNAFITGSVPPGSKISITQGNDKLFREKV